VFISAPRIHPKLQKKNGNRKREKNEEEEQKELEETGREQKK
jgi:hypothetical protein